MGQAHQVTTVLNLGAKKYKTITHERCILTYVVALFHFFFGTEILFLVRSATFLRKPELTQKHLLKESLVIEKIEKWPVVHRVKLDDEM